MQVVREFGFHRCVMIAALCWRALPGPARAESPALRQVRYQIVAGQSEQARTAAPDVAPDGEGRRGEGLSAVLWTQLPLGPDRGRGRPQPDIGEPKLQTPAVQAEKLPVPKSGLNFDTGARGRGIGVVAGTLEAVSGAAYRPGREDRRANGRPCADEGSNQTVARHRREAIRRLAHPVLDQNLAPEPVGGRGGRKTPDGASGKRFCPSHCGAWSGCKRCVSFRGTLRSPPRRKAKQVYRQVLAAGQFLRSDGLVHLQSLVRTISQPEALADWLGEVSEGQLDPATAATLKLEAIKEYMAVNRVDLARARVAHWRKSGSDCRAAEDYLRQRCWKVAGLCRADFRAGH